MAPLLAGIISTLISKGLPAVAQIVADKGAEYVEEKLGVKLEPNMSDERIAELRIAAMKHEEFKINAIVQVVNTEDDNLTKRHGHDMLSDSWLSKNIRPMTLIALVTGYFMFATMSAFGYDANEAYITLLGQWGMLIMSFYFGGRSAEKIIQYMKGK
jgi:hypothetical protein